MPIKLEITAMSFEELQGLLAEYAGQNSEITVKQDTIPLATENIEAVTKHAPPEIAPSPAIIDSYVLGDQGPTPTEELDSAGAVWSAELHAGTKTKTADGQWKKKRTVKKADVTQPVGGVISEPLVPNMPPVAQAPPASPRIDTLEAFTAYAQKINASGVGTFAQIQEFLGTIGILNVAQVPLEKLNDVALQVQLKFGVAF